ncbi:MAG TPA: TolC family protein [Fimbriimonas sp.]
MRTALLILALAPGCVLAQTPPIQPQTPPITVPPPIDLPSFVPEDERLGQPLTADEAVAIALRSQASLAVAAANVEAARGRTQQTRSQLLPQFSATGGYTRQESLSGAASSQLGGGSTNSFTAGLSVNQLLFDFGRTRDQVRQQQALERVSAQNLGTAEQQVVFQVRQTFQTYAEAVQLLTVSQDNVRNRQRQLDLAQARLNVGLGAPGDVVRARTTLADSVSALVAARNLATDTRVALANAMGVDPRTPINPSPTAEPAPALELERLVSTALEQRPEILAQREQINAARLGVSVANKTNAPRVGLTAGIGTRGQDQPFDSQTGTIGVSLTWPFGDSGLTSGRRREARAQEEAARAQLTVTSNTVVSEVSTAYLDLLHAEQRVTTAQEQVANARELVRISEGRYEGGIGTFLEVTDAQASLFAAERNLTAAVADVQQARTALNRAIGAYVRR